MRYFGTKKQIGNCNVYVGGVGGSIPLKHIVRHSPDGFQWGYGGSGPADLALSILTDYCETNNIKNVSPDTLYLKFKKDFIATADQHLSIDFDDIKIWLKRQVEKE